MAKLGSVVPGTYTRYQEIFFRTLDMTQQEVGQEYGVSRARIGEMARLFRRRLVRQAKAYKELHPRSQTAVRTNVLNWLETNEHKEYTLSHYNVKNIIENLISELTHHNLWTP